MQYIKLLFKKIYVKKYLLYLEDGAFSGFRVDAKVMGGVERKHLPHFAHRKC